LSPGDASQKPALLLQRAALGENGVLRLTTCGAVDDGKSTLMGRLLADAGAIFEDHLAALVSSSQRKTPDAKTLDYSLLFDGLEAEREQGITIDVAYRYFTTPKRKFIIADAPGHEDHTRNMATAASNADLAVALVDAIKGPTPQTLRHLRIAALVGVRHVIVAVNKMDLVGYDQGRFDGLARIVLEACQALGFRSVQAIPISATLGDNVVARSAPMAWWAGPTLLKSLEEIDTDSAEAARDFRLPVQMVTRLADGTRGYAGRIASGRVAPGDSVVIPHWGQAARVARLASMDGDLKQAQAGDSVVLTLDAEFDIARGDMLCGSAKAPFVADRFTARLICLSETGVLPGRRYLLKSGGKTLIASIGEILERVSFGPSEETSAADELALNAIATCTIACAQPLTFDRFEDNRTTGAFILIDRAQADTVAAGMILDPPEEGRYVRPQAMGVNRTARAALNGHKPAILWFTGLSGAGKSTIADLVEQRLHALGVHTYGLDGDNLRLGLMSDLGFSRADRVENIRRAGEVARLFVDAGLIVTCAFISPYAAERNAVRDLVGPDEFIEIFVDAPLATCRSRDPKGLYRRVAAGEIKGFTGVDSPYEAPAAPELHFDTTAESAAGLADRVVRYLRERGILE
jgi:bifunctional enzyme CysN/CysC